MNDNNNNDGDDDIIPGRFYGVYCCSKDTDEEHTFKSWNPHDEKRKCRIHSSREAIRIEYRELKKSDIPDGYRLFGRFVCDRCHNEWGSANSWKGFYQECKRCKEVSCQVITWDFNFLRKGEGNNKNGHLIDECGKCKELKRKGIADSCLKKGNTILNKPK